MSKTFLITIVLFNCLQLSAAVTPYSISFKIKTDTVSRLISGEQVRTIEIIANNFDKDDQKDFKLYVTVDNLKTSLPPKDFEILHNLNGVDLKSLKANGNFIIIKIKQDDKQDIQNFTKKIYLKLEIKRGDELQNGKKDDISEFELNIIPAFQALKGYRFLGYLGTNFDLVDGVQARNLFLATNIFIPEYKKFGISIGLYGNRTMSRIDTARNAIFTSRISSIGDTAIVYYRDSAMQVTKRVSDNIGAYFSPLIPLKFLGDGDLKIYFAPNLEFIWRRANIEDEYINNSTYSIDTIIRSRPLGRNTSIRPLTSKQNLNSFAFYFGYLGLLLRYETDEISIRLNGSVGTAFNYFPNTPLSVANLTYSRKKIGFFFGRLTLTEPNTGLTIGAEISNYFSENNALPYYNVTLSKAFNLKDFGTILKPLNSNK